VIHFLQSVKTFLSSWARAVKAALDIRDFFVFGGLGMVGYGFFLLRPWLGWTIAGSILLYMGLFYGRRPAK